MCLHRYVDRKDFQYMDMDTDSAYMALYAPMHLVVRPGMRRGFYKNYGDWFPRPYCERHREDFVKTQIAEGGDAWVPGECCANQHKHDKGTPGLFKVEFEGTGMVALSLKTYPCWGSAVEKTSNKELSKRTNKFTKEIYRSVLEDQLSVEGTNKSFVLKDNTMFTYSQLRTILTFLYAKKRVLAEGVSTECIDV